MRKLTFLILSLEGALLSFNVAASAALVPSIASEFALSQFIAGRIVWIYMLTYGVGALFYGPLVRVFDAKKIELICVFFFSLANLLAGFSQNIQSLYAARFFMGLFGSSVIPLGIILIAKHVEAKNRGRQVGLFFSITFIASLAGLFLSGIIPWRWIYFIPGLAGFVLLVIMYFFLPSFKEDKGKIRINYLEALKSRKFINVFIYIFCISLFYHGVQQWLAVYFSSSFKLNQFVVSMLITLTSLSGIFGEALGGLMADKAGRLKTINIGIILMIVAVAALFFKLPVWFLGILMFIWGLGWTFNHAGVSTVLTDLPQDFLNEAASLNSGVRFVSGGFGAAVAGVLMNQSFALGFGVFLLGLVTLLLMSKFLILKK